MANIELKFTETEVPTETRERKPNPVLDKVQQMIDKRNEDPTGKGKALTFSLPRNNDDDEKALESVINAFQNAGREKGVTVRKSVVTEKGVATVTVWVVDKITRRTPEEVAAEKAAKAK